MQTATTLAVANQASFHGKGHRRPRLGDVLVEAGLISVEQRDKALAVQKAVGRRHLGDILVRMGFADDETIARALATQLGLPFVALTGVQLQKDLLESVELRFIMRNACLPIFATGRRVLVAMADPTDLVTIDDIERLTQRKAHVVVATMPDIQNALLRWYESHPSEGNGRGSEAAREEVPCEKQSSRT